MNPYERYICGLPTTNSIMEYKLTLNNGGFEMSNRAIMNTMKKGMLVKWYGAYGIIKAFDYTHLKVGIVLDAGKTITRWANPSDIEIIYTNKFSYKGPKPNKVIADVEAGVTVVMWDDGEKTIVRAAEGTTPDVYNAFCAAFCKRMYGTNSALKRNLKDILVIKEKKEKK